MNQFADLVRACLKENSDIAAITKKFVDQLGQAFLLERCAVLLFADEASSLKVTAEFSADGNSSLIGKIYHLGVRSEFSRLLRDGRPLPVQDILESGASALQSFVGKNEGVVAFPLVGHENLLGCLTMHRAEGKGNFSDELIEVGEALSKQVAIAIDLASTLRTLNRQASFFSEAASACLVVERETLTVLSANTSAARLLTGANVSIEGINLSDLLTPKAAVAERIKSAVSQGCAQSASDLTLTAAKSGSNYVGLLAYPIADERTDVKVRQKMVAVILYDQRDSASLSKTPQQPEEKLPEADVSNQATLSRQLTWERWMRQIVCRVHSTLDRDSIMQSVVDSLGRALSVSRCMVVRTEAVTAPIVTHEFAEPDVSPLGLGRTGQFPARTAAHFKTRVKAVADIVAERPNLQISEEELEWFLDNGFSSLAGAPISRHGHIYGVVVAISCGAPRKWLPNELDMLEVAAAEAAIALENSQAFMQVKDQLFNMNLLGNLTQQLTNTLEMASRNNRPEGMEDKSRSEAGGPPLSFRELEVLKLIASGLANREIAQRLFLTESTVELHASRIRKKLKLKSRTALVKYACDNDLV